jgi:UDP:flavonoid glycosyltransferase YjiC (YdhE family)
VIPVQNLAITQLRALVSEMLSNCSYKENAQRLQAEFNTAGGVAAAADLIEAMEQQ